ncbi:virB8 family protein [Cognatiluteimonas profundi]|uniref:virB8 family protein n=1 Tax=Cognatiluteimonas profundi TaxID=2594501 RepID=UPI00131B650B|nr:type IV secretion system protein [Lysobacter profundi]
MTSTPPPPAGLARALSRSVDFETSLADVVRRSERRAWLVAACAVALALLLAGGYLVVLPLKEKVPYLVMADAYTGTSTVARLSGDFNHAGITAGEAINRSNVAHFVLARESYDYALIRLRDWATVYTMASPAVAADYSRLHASRNPDSPFNTYGKGRSIRVAILSIQLLRPAPDAAPRGATVRFQREVHDNASGATRPLDNRIATLEFAYKPELGMDEKDRIENPLGFQVTTYRVDNDYAPDPPLEDSNAAREAAAPATAADQAPIVGVAEKPAATEAAP